MPGPSSGASSTRTRLIDLRGDPRQNHPALPTKGKRACGRRSARRPKDRASPHHGTARGDAGRISEVLRGVVAGLRDGAISSDALKTFKLDREFGRGELEIRREYLKLHGDGRPRRQCRGREERPQRLILFARSLWKSATHSSGSRDGLTPPRHGRLGPSPAPGSALWRASARPVASRASRQHALPRSRRRDRQAAAHRRRSVSPSHR